MHLSRKEKSIIILRKLNTGIFKFFVQRDLDFNFVKLKKYFFRTSLPTQNKTVHNNYMRIFDILIYFINYYLIHLFKNIIQATTYSGEGNDQLHEKTINT